MAEGYRKGKRVVKEVVETAGEAVSLATSCQRIGDITVVNVELRDKKGRFVPNARPYLTLKVGGSGHIIGAGNGDPAYMGPDNPGTVDCKDFSIYAFNGRAQFIIQGERGTLQLSNNPHADGRL